MHTRTVTFWLVGLGALTTAVLFSRWQAPGANRVDVRLKGVPYQAGL